MFYCIEADRKLENEEEIKGSYQLLRTQPQQTIEANYIVLGIITHAIETIALIMRKHESHIHIFMHEEYIECKIMLNFKLY